MREFGNFEPGSGLGSATCGLGELLPVLPSNDAKQVAQYDVLASGAAQGGNFQHFKDGAELGYFTNDKAGYANYIAYNSLGLNDVRVASLPDLVGWFDATVFAYAVVAKMQVGNYDVPTGLTNGTNSILSIATNSQWTATQRAAAMQSFTDNYYRLLKKWGYTGTLTPATTAVMIENPYFKSLGKIVFVDQATVTYDGPDPDPNIIDGRMFSAGGVTWKWGGKVVAVPPTRYLEIYVDGNNPANPPQYDERQWMMYPTLAWFVVERFGRDANGVALPERRTALTKWTGEYLNYADTGPMGYLMFVNNESAADQATIRAVGGSSAPPSKSEWGWGKNTNMPTGAPQNPIIPITDPRNPNSRSRPARSTPTVNPWTDVAVPPPPPPARSTPTVNPWTDVAVPPPPPSTGSQPIIPPGVPPRETITGALVPSVTGAGGAPDIAVNEGAQTAGVDAGSVASGSFVAMLGGLAVLMLLGSRPGRRK